MKRLILLIVLCYAGVVHSQIVFEPVENAGVYEFLDEMASVCGIGSNSAIKPYSRRDIANHLWMIRQGLQRGNYSLTKRQQAELFLFLEDFSQELPFDSLSLGNGVQFLKTDHRNLNLDYDPVGLHYRDSIFTLSLRPVLGAGFVTNSSGNGYERYWGASLTGYVGKHLGFYASLRDNNGSEPFGKTEYLVTNPGQIYKTRDNGSVDYSEMRGGIIGSVSWGSISLLLDRFTWGDQYHGSNIFSSKAPPFPMLQLKLNPVKWFDFTYFHGWLNSNVVDSSRSYYNHGDYRIVYRNKFLAANMFTFIPWKNLNISIGNSIVYSDQNLNPLYFIPFLFFNAADAVKNNYNNDAGSNSQLFFNISSRNIRHLHLFLSLYIDEWKTSRLFDPERHNFTSMKVGFKVDDLVVRNFSLTGEYTRTQPMTYKHFIPSATFASNDYNLGNYLKDNAEEVYIEACWRPYRGLKLVCHWNYAVRGEDIPYVYDGGYEVDKIPFIQNKTWQRNNIGLTARFEYINNGYFFLQYLHGVQQGLTGYLPSMFNGKSESFGMGIYLGL